MSTTVITPPSLDVRVAQQSRPHEHPAMHQSWQELLFLHWRFDPEVAQATLPAGLTIDTFEGEAWIGIVPFFMRDIRPWWFLPVPGISNFQEVNLRTYVVDEEGTPGVWFFSLDADTRLGVWWGKTFYKLPYSYARMTHERDPQSDRIDYRSHRPGTESRLDSCFSYRPVGQPRTAEPGTLEFFLVERYVLFSPAGKGRLATGRVFHPPYELYDAEAAASDSLFELNGLPRPDRSADHAVMSRRVDVDIFALKTSSP